MAKRHIHTCYVCGTEYEYCESCAIIKPAYNANRFCSQAHQDIFAILSKHGCQLKTAEEVIAALEPYDTTNVVGDIARHLESLKAEITKEVEYDEPTQE